MYGYADSSGFVRFICGGLDLSSYQLVCFHFTYVIHCKRTKLHCILGDAEAILFLSPVATAVAGRVLLKETMPVSIFATTPITLGGLVFICQPSFIFGGSDYRDLSWQGIVFMFAVVFCWSATCILIRTAKSAHWLQLEIATSMQTILLWCPLLIMIDHLWISSDVLEGGDWDFSVYTLVVMLIIGILGFFSVMCGVIGYQIGDATKVAWMEYLDLVFAFLYQYLYFKETPTTWEIIGFCALLSTCFVHVGEEYYHYWTALKEKEKEHASSFVEDDNSL